MPVTNRAVDVYGKVRADYGPRAASTVNRTVRGTWNASEPYRNEAVARGTVALAGLRGRVRPDEIAVVVKDRGRSRRIRTMMWLGAAGSGVAIAAAGAAAWRMSRGPAWVADDGADDSPSADGGEESDIAPGSQDGLTTKMKGAAHRVTDRVKVLAHHTADAATPNGTNGSQGLDM
jgi:hypothetical protein